MASKSKRDSFDALTSRIFVILIALSFIALGSFALSQDIEAGLVQLAFGWICTVAGIIAVVAGLALSDKNVEKLSDKSGYHELLFIYVAASLALVWLIKRIKKEL